MDNPVARPAPPTEPDQFSWKDDDCIVLWPQQAIAIYENQHRDLVIRQQADWNEEDDRCIIISKHAAQEFLRALTEAVAGLGKNGP